MVVLYAESNHLVRGEGGIVNAPAATMIIGVFPIRVEGITGFYLFP